MHMGPMSQVLPCVGTSEGFSKHLWSNGSTHPVWMANLLVCVNHGGGGFSETEWKYRKNSAGSIFIRLWKALSGIAISFLLIP